jgi:hypothetical protein
MRAAANRRGEAKSGRLVWLHVILPDDGTVDSLPSSSTSLHPPEWTAAWCLPERPQVHRSFEIKRGKTLSVRLFYHRQNNF